MSGPPGRGGRGAAPDMPGGIAMFSLQNIRQPLMAADQNLDRDVTLDEFRSSQSRRFATLDVNRDGLLDMKELPPTPAQKMLGRRQR
jgi:hypothetical protein